jgi:hypothetical protein
VRKYHDPKRRHLAPDGERVPLTPEWVRAIRCGDVVIVDDEAAKTKVKAKAPSRTEGL